RQGRVRLLVGVLVETVLQGRGRGDDLEGRSGRVDLAQGPVEHRVVRVVLLLQLLPGLGVRRGGVPGERRRVVGRVGGEGQDLAGGRLDRGDGALAALPLQPFVGGLLRGGVQRGDDV